MASHPGINETITKTNSEQCTSRSVAEDKQCDPNLVLAGMTDGVFLSLCPFIHLPKILSLRLLCKAANDRFNRHDYGWNLLLHFSGLTAYGNLAQGFQRLLHPSVDRSLSCKSILSRWMINERMWTYRNYSHETTLKLTGRLKLARTGNSRSLIQLNEHIDRGGCRASAEIELRWSGNYQHIQRSFGKLNSLMGYESSWNRKNQTYSVTQLSQLPAAPTEKGSLCNLILYTMQNASHDPIEPTASGSNPSLLSCTEISMRSSRLGRRPTGYQKLRQSSSNSKHHISTWSAYVDLRQSLITTETFREPSFPPGLVIGWPTVIMENALSDHVTSFKSFGRASIHLVYPESGAKTEQPSAVFWFDLDTSSRSDQELSSLSTLGFIEQNGACTWIMAAGTNIGMVYFAVSNPTTLNVSNPNQPETITQQIRLLYLRTKIEEVRLSVDEHFMNSGKIQSHNSSPEIGRSIVLYVLGQRGQLQILSTHLETVQPNRQDLLTAKWDCVFRIEAEGANLSAFWSPPMKQLMLCFKSEANDECLSDSYCFSVQTATDKSLAYKCASIKFDNASLKNCEVCMLIPSGEQKLNNEDSIAENAPYPMIEATVEKMTRWIAKLGGMPLKQVYPAAFLGCWIIVMRSHLNIISVTRGKRQELTCHTKGQLLGHQVPIYLSAFDGFHRFASIDVNGEVLVWDIARCRRLFKLHVLEGDSRIKPHKKTTRVSPYDDTFESGSDSLSEKGSKSAFSSPLMNSRSADSTTYDKKVLENSLDEHFPVLQSSSAGSPAPGHAVLTPKTKPYYAEKCRVHRENENNKSSPQRSYELEYYEQLSRQLHISPDEFLSAYETQLIHDLKKEAAPLMGIPKEEPPRSPFAVEEELSIWCAQKDGVDVSEWIREQQVQMRRYGEIPKAQKKMSTVLGRKIQEGPEGSLLEELELPWIESVSLVEDIFGVNKAGVSAPTAALPTQRATHARIARLGGGGGGAAGEPVVDKMILDDEHLALFFPCLQTWQVWEFSTEGISNGVSLFALVQKR